MKNVLVASLLALCLGANLGGCAAGGYLADGEDLETKTEAVVGASCTTDAECGAWEYCDRLLCIPERECPPAGVCRAQTRFYDDDGAAIPDASSTGVTRTIHVGRPGLITSAMVHVSIQHTYRGDLHVLLRSPSGTEVVLHDRAGGGADDLLIATELASVVGERAEGDWQLVVRDLARADVGRILTWRLEIEVAESDAPPPADASAIWATVPLAEQSIGSSHPYGNLENETWDLRRFTGGASRARVRFGRIDLERNYDFVEVLDAESGAVLDRFTGTYASFTTRDYDTGALAIRFTSDRSVTRWGFEVEAVEVFGAGCLADEDCGVGQTCLDEIRCITWPCFQLCAPAPGVEGAACETSAECAEELYCAADGTCRPDGTCGYHTDADCGVEGNSYYHILCVGHPYCTDAGTCGWRCGADPECAEGDTTNDGCNTCTCSGGRWACTERYCPPTAAEGEPCSPATECEEGLVCDRASAGVCGDGRDGICTTDDRRYCRQAYMPVCTCTGQTFDNHCERQGQAEYAHDGRCELALAIPDANTTGIRHSVQVQAPTGATRVRVAVEIDHSYRGDLVVVVVDPMGRRHVLTNLEGGSADDFDYGGTIDLGTFHALGTWTLEVSDRARADVGVLRFFNVIAEAASSTGRACGSRGLAPCATGEHCHWDAGAGCGRADGPGTCRETPSVCTREYRPVCGCDGVTYGNACMAASAGVGIDHDGGC